MTERVERVVADRLHHDGWTSIGTGKEGEEQAFRITQKKDMSASCTGRLRFCVGPFETVTKKISQGEKHLFWVKDPEISLHHGEEGVAEQSDSFLAGWEQRDEDSVAFASLLAIPLKSLTHEKVSPTFRVCLSPCFSQGTSSQTHLEECFAFRSKLIKWTIRINRHRARYGVWGWIWVLVFYWVKGKLIRKSKQPECRA